jgi:hypothetical protein
MQQAPAAHPFLGKTPPFLSLSLKASCLLSMLLRPSPSAPAASLTPGATAVLLPHRGEQVVAAVDARRRTRGGRTDRLRHPPPPARTDADPRGRSCHRGSEVAAPRVGSRAASGDRPSPSSLAHMDAPGPHPHRCEDDEEAAARAGTMRLGWIEGI